MDITKEPLNNEDIQNKINCKFILYENMHNINNIEQLLPATLILYQLRGDGVGHFCCVFENSEGVNFFDPLGFKPDEELKLMNSPINSIGHDFTYLLRLLANTNKPIIYNNHKLQSHKTSTCGHWCTVRMACRDLYCDEFAKCFTGIKNKDLLIAKIYNSI